jgi:hypothetical protein
MDILEILRLNLLSPMVLSFILGIVAVLVKSDLRIPEQVYGIISIYLLFAIGLKGGFDLARSPSINFGAAALAAIFLGVIIVLVGYALLRYVGEWDDFNAIAIALHYGAVSAATLSAAVTFLNEAGQSFEGFMPTIYVIMEIPAVIAGLALAGYARQDGVKQGPVDVLRRALSGKSFLLLGGGVLIGYISGEPGYQQVKPFFVDLFSGFFTLFLLEMGTRVGKRLDDLRDVGLFVVFFSFAMPIVFGLVGTWLGSLAGLSTGGAMIMGTLSASASFITAPAVIETNLPEADVSYALTASLVLTFPFNLTLGLPLYFEMARLFA